jgi:hypothetical protein
MYLYWESFYVDFNQARYLQRVAAIGGAFTPNFQYRYCGATGIGFSASS